MGGFPFLYLFVSRCIEACRGVAQDPPKSNPLCVHTQAIQRSTEQSKHLAHRARVEVWDVSAPA